MFDKFIFHRCVHVGSGLWMGLLAAHAAAQPHDAGRVLRSLPDHDAHDAPVLQSTPTLTLQSATPLMSTMPGSTLAMQVKEFRIEGARLLSQPRLEAIVQPFAGKTMTLSQLQEVADAVTAAYRDAGYVYAYALVLPQALREGVVTITVREGQLDRLDLPEARQNTLPRVARDALAQSARVGEPLNATALLESLLLVNHLPAAPRASADVESAVDGRSAVHVAYAPAKRISGTVVADNAGQRLTGHARVGASLLVHDPLGAADQFKLTVMTSGQQLRFGQADYAVPVTPRTAVAASLSDVRYDLCCQPPGTSAQGFARTAQLQATHRWVMQAQRQITLFASVERLQLNSEYNLPLHHTHRIQATALGVHGHWLDTGINHWSSAVRVGRANLADSALDFANDASGAQVHGSFAKALGSFYRLQSLGGQWSVLAQVRAQANLERNLESAERISLGGAQGVRAYASGEGVGDSGVLANLEVRYAVADAPGLSLFGFFDTGTIRRYSKNPDALAGAIPNSYALTGMGAGLRYELPTLSVSVTVARPWGNNAGADAAGNNHEGQRDGPRGWVTAAWKF